MTGFLRAPERTAGEAVVQPGAATGRPSLSTATLVGLAASSVALCWLLISADFAIVAGFVIVATLFYRDDPGRPVAFGAFLVLVGAALATVLEAGGPNGDPTLSFATDRPLAAQAGNVAGALLAVAVVMFAVVERPSQAAPRWLPATSARASRRDLARRVAAARTWAAPAATIGVVAAVIRVVAAPPALSGAVAELADRVRSGTGYVVTVDGRAVAATDHPPLAPVLAAFWPVGPRLLALLCSLALVVAVAAVAHRFGGRRAALLAAAVAAVAPSLWDQQLAVLAAGLAVTVAVLLADPERLDLRRAVGAGVLAGLAGLARPEALLAVPVLAGWIALGPRRRDTWRGVAAVVAVAAAVVLPWFGPAGPGTITDRTVGAIGALLVEPGASSRLPWLLGAGAGGLLVVATAVAMVRDADAWHADWRRRLPLLALPVVAAVLSVLSAGAREPLTWAAGLAAAVVGVGFADLVPASWVGGDPAGGSVRRGDEHEAGVLATEADGARQHRAG
ncbi:MAG: glycosyltransferase family 39 protein [Acidimicrobiales bacterium]